MIGFSPADGSVGRDSAKLRSRPFEYDAETETVAAILRAMGVAQRAPRAVGVEPPAAAADHFAIGTARRGWIDDRLCGVRAHRIRGPLPGVAVHVAQAPRVCRERSGLRNGRPVDASRLSRERKLTVVVRLIGC